MSKPKAIYLRKSRDESDGKEDVLAKHRRICAEICERNGWDYVMYEEIGSSDTLDARPQMTRLLEDVEDGRYDGVVVVEYERLSRGDELDAARIKHIFRAANVKIITPTKTHDLNDEDEEVLVGVMALLARREYQRTKRRFARGKREGAAMGKWTQGKPPFPYAYDRASKSVTVDEAKRSIYEKMRDEALLGTPLRSIAYDLNRSGSKGDRGKPWDESAVKKVLLNRFHLGEVIYNKTRRVGAKVVKVDPSEWIRGIGDHERLITPEQFARISALVASRARIANRSKAGSFPLSGLVKCALCGSTHTTAEKRGRHVLYSCGYKTPTGELCANAGVQASAVYRAIEIEARHELERITQAVNDAQPRKPDRVTFVDSVRRELAEEEARLSRLVDLRMDAKVSVEMYDRKRVPIEASIQRLKVTLADLELASETGTMTDEERRAKIGDILRGDYWTRADLTDKERHGDLVTLIDRIELRAVRVPGKARKVESVSINIVWR